MSDTQTPATPIASTLTVEQVQALIQDGVDRVIKMHDMTPRDRVIASANSLPDLISKAAMVDPELVQKFTGKALIASKSPWGTLAGGVIAWAVGHYGLQWDQATCDALAGFTVLVAGYGMRLITEHPITGILMPATPAQAAAKVG